MGNLFQHLTGQVNERQVTPANLACGVPKQVRHDEVVNIRGKNTDKYPPPRKRGN